MSKNNNMMIMAICIVIILIGALAATGVYFYSNSGETPAPTTKAAGGSGTPTVAATTSPAPVITKVVTADEPIPEGFWVYEIKDKKALTKPFSGVPSGSYVTAIGVVGDSTKVGSDVKFKSSELPTDAEKLKNFEKYVSAVGEPGNYKTLGKDCTFSDVKKIPAKHFVSAERVVGTFDKIGKDIEVLPFTEPTKITLTEAEKLSFMNPDTKDYIKVLGRVGKYNQLGYDNEVVDFKSHKGSNAIRACYGESGESPDGDKPGVVGKDKIERGIIEWYLDWEGTLCPKTESSIINSYATGTEISRCCNSGKYDSNNCYYYNPEQDNRRAVNVHTLTDNLYIFEPNGVPGEYNETENFHGTVRKTSGNFWRFTSQRPK